MALVQGVDPLQLRSEPRDFGRQLPPLSIVVPGHVETVRAGCDAELASVVMDPNHPLHADHDPEPAGAAALVFVLALMLGAAAGFLIGAVKVESPGTFEDVGFAVMVQQPLAGADKVFNWLLFTVFVAAGLVAGAVVWAGNAVVRGQRIAARATLGVPPQA